MTTTKTEPEEVKVAATKPELEEEETFVGIRYLVGFLRVIEDLITAISGYGIVFALGVGVVDLFTDGQLTNSLPWLDYLYALALAAGIGGQLIAVSSRASRAFHNGNIFAGIGFTLLALLLGVVEYEAAVVYGYHKVFNQPVALSLEQLGISQGGFVQLRSVTSVVLALLSGFLRYQPKRKKSIEEIEAEEAYKRRKNAAQMQTRQEQVKALRGMVKQTVGRKDEAQPDAAAETETSANDDGQVGESEGEETPEDKTLNPPWLKQNRWRWQELQAWLRTEYSVDVSEDQCKEIIKKTAGAERLKRAGNPLVAPIGRLKQKAITELNLRKVTPMGERKAVNG